MLKRFFVGVVALFAMFAVITPSASAKDGFHHHVVFHVSDNDKAKMNVVLNNAMNVTNYYAKQDKKVQIEIVAYGPGLHMLRDDSSPVKDRVANFSGSFPNISFAACGNTLAKMEKKEGKKPTLIDSDGIHVVTSGVVQIMERQDQNWHYIRP